MISRASDVRLPSNVDSEYTIVDLDGGVFKERIPGASMFCLSVKLLDIIYDILETVYLDFRTQTTESPESRNADMLGKTMKLGHQLSQCLDSFSDRLRSFITNPPSASYVQAPDFSLHEQALVTRLAIFPPRSTPSLFCSQGYRR